MIRKRTDDGVTEYAYDNADNPLSIAFKNKQSEEQRLDYTYDALGQLLSETNSAGLLEYQYDELGNLETLTLPDQRQLNHLYYGSGHLHQLNLSGRVISDFERDSLHNEVLRTQGALHTRTRYDRNGRLSQKALHYQQVAREVLPLLQKDYQYDASDNLVAEILTQTQRPSANRPTAAANDDNLIGRFHNQSSTGKSYQGSAQYGYNPVEQIQSLHRSSPASLDQHIESLNYDAAGNLFDGYRVNGLIKHNRVHVYQDKRYRYDRFGRLSEKRSGSLRIQRFEYDAEHRLIEVQQQNGALRQRVVFGYDPLGRRISKQVYHDDASEPSNRTLFHWQGLRLLEEVLDGRPSLYVYAEPGSYEPLARIDGKPGSEAVFYFHTNLAGLPEQLTDSDGNTVWHSEYQAWGRTRDEWHDRQAGSDQNLRFQGQYLDRETGLHYNIFRFFDPDVGRFTTPDPIGLAGGFNLYQYAPNPIVWADPWGWAYAGVDFTGSSDLFPTTGTQRNIVTINMQGRRTRDFTQAFKEAGIPKSAAAGYTWHHVDDFIPQKGTTTMQLVKTSAHEATFPHGGSVAQFEKHFKVKYDTREAILVASKNGWLANRIPKNKLRSGRCP
ncbi:RHS repeat-associated core domain-containing protein [uncultured Pseudomonas sp.]|uniref:RHS repeat-associated core domain-containing protein n=2 Tax=Gammaproteobacteria TaxID=1236 RepID=UPI0025D8F215|nr:RHS repeat-associated core domain-containing protein [uncultured Pseudomonas sp.]